MPLALEEDPDARQVAGAVFREGIEHDAGDEMLDVGVDETVEHVAGKFLQFILRQVKGGEQLVSSSFGRSRVVSSSSNITLRT